MDLQTCNDYMKHKFLAESTTKMNLIKKIRSDSFNKKETRMKLMYGIELRY